MTVSEKDFRDVLGNIYDAMTSIRSDISDVKEGQAAIPGNIAKAIKSCQIYQETRRRWSIGTLFTIFSLGIAISAFIVSFVK